MNLRCRHIALMAFPCVLWAVAAFFFLGDIGLWNDDWFYIQRVPETGAIRSLVLDRPIHIWRPLYRVLVPALLTACAEHPWVPHTISAMAHGVAALLVYMLLRRLSVGRLGAGAAALVFMVFPWHTEVVFWCCNLPTSLAAWVALLALLFAADRSTTALRVGLVSFACTFVACCLNEQPALLVLAVPIVFIGARLERPEKPGSRARQMAFLAAAPILALGLYTLLARWIVGPLDIGSGHGLLPPSRWASSVLHFLGWLEETACSAEWIKQAWQHARTAATQHPVRAGILAAAMVATGLMWVAGARGGRYEASSVPEPRGRRAWILFAGLIMTLAPLGPIIGFGYWLNPRVLYPSAVGLAVVLAALLARLDDRESSPRARVLVAAALALGLAAGAVAMVGVQQGYRERFRLDEKVLESLRALVPSPEPGTVFVPARVEPWWTPREAAFRSYFWSIFNSWWSAEPALRLAYRRSDLYCGFTAANESPWGNPRPRSVIVKGIGRTGWAKVVPFTIKPDGRVELIREVRFTNRAGVERTIVIPQVDALVRVQAIPTSTWEFARPSLPENSRLGGSEDEEPAVPRRHAS